MSFGSGTGGDAGRHARRPSWPRLALVAAALAGVVAVGVLGVVQYGVTFWRYRGFPPPRAPSSVLVSVPGGHRLVRVESATVERIVVRGPSIGNWAAPVVVVLPPGYAQHPWLRFPVLYLLCGSPGEPSNFLDVGNLLTTYEVLVAEGMVKPMIIVAPSGARSFFSDSEWVNGVLPASGWETFVADTLVGTIDHRFRVDSSAADRGIGGLSEGGYGALNIGVHHPDEFGLLESWSGYVYADDIPAIFDHDEDLLRANSPMEQLPARAHLLRANHVFVWFYVGHGDPLWNENRLFAQQLALQGIAHRFILIRGIHSWALWRTMMAPALIAASEHLGHG